MGTVLMTISRTYALGVQEAQLRFDFGAFPENALELGIRPKLGERYSNSIFLDGQKWIIAKNHFLQRHACWRPKADRKEKEKKKKSYFRLDKPMMQTSNIHRIINLPSPTRPVLYNRVCQHSST